MMWTRTICDKSLKKTLAEARNNLARDLRQYRKLVKSGDRYSFEGGIQLGICLGEQTQILAAEAALKDMRIKTILDVNDAREKGEWVGTI